MVQIKHAITLIWSLCVSPCCLISSSNLKGHFCKLFPIVQNCWGTLTLNMLAKAFQCPSVSHHYLSWNMEDIEVPSVERAEWWITPVLSILPAPSAPKDTEHGDEEILVVSLLSHTSQTISIILRSEAGSACRLQYLSIKQAWDNRGKCSGTAKST